MLAIIEFLGLSLYEIIIAYLLDAFKKIPNNKKIIYLFFALLPLMIMTMFHSINIGNDSKEYVYFFNQLKFMSLENALNFSRFENGYVIFTYLLTKISDDPQIIFVVEGAFIYLSLARWLNKWCKAPGLFICLLVNMLVIDGWMSMIRQALAMAILFYAFDAIIESKPIKFIFITLFAAQFHNVGYAFLIAYPVINHMSKKHQAKKKKIMDKFNILIIFIGLISTIIITPLINYLISVFPIYQYYVNGAYMDGETRIAVVLKIIIYGLMIIVPLIIARRTFFKDELLGNNIKNLYRLAFANIFFLLLALKATIFMRIVGIFSIYAVLAYSESICLNNYKQNRQIMILLTIVCFVIYGLSITILKTPEWQTTYPFEWCF